MELDYLLSDYKGYISVTPENSSIVQQFLFSLGYKWYNGKIVQYERNSYLVIYKDETRLARNSYIPPDIQNVTDAIMTLIYGNVPETYEFW